QAPMTKARVKRKPGQLRGPEDRFTIRTFAFIVLVDVLWSSCSSVESFLIRHSRNQKGKSRSWTPTRPRPRLRPRLVEHAFFQKIVDLFASIFLIRDYWWLLALR